MLDRLAERRQQGLCLLLQAPRALGLQLELLPQGREFPDQVDQAELLPLTVVPRRLDAAPSSRSRVRASTRMSSSHCWKRFRTASISMGLFMPNQPRRPEVTQGIGSPAAAPEAGL